MDIYSQLPDSKDILAGNNPYFPVRAADPVGSLKDAVRELFDNPQKYAIPQPSLSKDVLTTLEEAAEEAEQCKKHANSASPEALTYAFVTIVSYDLKDEFINSIGPQQLSFNEKFDNALAWIIEWVPTHFQIMFLKAVVRIYMLPVDFNAVRLSSKERLQELSKYL